MIVIGCDHGGYELKKTLEAYLNEKGLEYIDIGCNGEAVDYPDIAAAACAKITDKTADKGILICGTGIGISMWGYVRRCARITSLLNTPDFTTTLTLSASVAELLGTGLQSSCSTCS